MNAHVAKCMLDLAARHACGAAGHVEPNPLVGAVLTQEPRAGAATVAEADILAIGHHRRFGELHAEREAINRAHELGHSTRGSTLYVTLEPCIHTGKQPPCTQAIIDAGIVRVICARRDPNPLAMGGAAVLRRAGVSVEFTDASSSALELAAPFIARLSSPLPWIIAKWASTIDGRLATRTGSSKWISGSRSRRHVQFLRSRVDAIVTGIGTVLADDPELTCREVPARRRAIRVVLDSQLRIATVPGCKLLGTLSSAPLLILTTEQNAASPAAELITELGAMIAPVPSTTVGGLDVRAGFELLRRQFAASTVLVEAGGRLLGSVLQGDDHGPLADELHVYTGPLLIGDRRAGSIDGERAVVKIADAARWRLIDSRRMGGDVRSIYRRSDVANDSDH